MTTLTLNLGHVVHLTNEQFYQLCQVNRDVKLERNAKGHLIVMPPTGGESGKRNAGLTAQLWLWNERTQLGATFDSSTA